MALLIGGLFFLPVPSSEILNLADQQRMQGKWTVVKWYINGIDGTTWSQGEVVEEFQGRAKLLWNVKEPTKILKCTYRLEAAKKPKRIIVTSDGVEMRGIYEFDKDILRIAFSHSKEFPKNFEPCPNGEASTLRFRGK
jgi:uncharacterized protein (TIGR03067 family)